MLVCNEELALPEGVVAQPLLDDRSRPGWLLLSTRYPLGLIDRLGLLLEYRELVLDVKAALEQARMGGRTRERRAEQRQLFWRDYMRKQHEVDTYTTTMEVFGVVLDHFSAFAEKGVALSVCHRSRVDAESHQPRTNQWIEFVAVAEAPSGYKSLFSVTSTFIMPICTCLRTEDLLRVILPNVAVLKLLPRSESVAADSPPRVCALLESKGLNEQFAELATELDGLGRLKSGLWRADRVAEVVMRRQAYFEEKGVSVHACKLFCLAAVDRLFIWLELVDAELLPGYVPQYVVHAHDSAVARPQPPDRPALVSFAKKRVDAYSNEEYVPSLKTEPLRKVGNGLRNRQCLRLKTQPQAFWFDDVV